VNEQVLGFVAPLRGRGTEAMPRDRKKVLKGEKKPKRLLKKKRYKKKEAGGIGGFPPAMTATVHY